MQNRKRGKIWDLNESINDSTVQDFRYSDCDSSEHPKEHEEPQITDQFRHWTNLVRNVSNRATTRLRDLLVNKPKSQTKTGSNSSLEEEEEAKDNQNEGDTSCNTSSDAIMESSNEIDDEVYDRRVNHGRQKSASCAGRKSNHLTADYRLLRQGMVNRVNMSPLVVAHGIPSHPPVLILPRSHHGSTRRSTHSGFNESGHNVQWRSHHIRDDKCCRTNGSYQHHHHLSERQRKSKASHAQENLSFLSDAQQIPEKLESLKNGLRLNEKNTTKRLTQTTGSEMEHGRQQYFRKLKHSNRRTRDFDSESYAKGLEFLTPSHSGRDSLEEFTWIPEKYGAINISQGNVSNHQLRFIGHGQMRKMAWDLQYAGVSLKHNSCRISSRNVSTSPCTEDSSSQTLRVFEKQSSELQGQTTLDRDATDFTSSLRVITDYESVESPVKESVERQYLDPLSHVTDASIRDSKISHEVNSPAPHVGGASEHRHCKITKKINAAPDKGSKSSTMTENSVDTLLRNLRGRMDALADIYPPDVVGYSDGLFRSIDRDGREKIALTKRRVVGSCLTRTYLPPSLERKPSEVRIHFDGPPEEEARLSFSDRIRDIWRYGESRAWKSSPRRDVKSEKELSLKLSVHGLNQPPVFREYPGEHNNSVTLTRILEKLIDSKTKTRVIESPTPLPRLNRKRSKTNLVDVGVQKSMFMSTRSIQNFVRSSKYRQLQEPKSRSESSGKNFKKIPIETPRPLQVFSGDSVIPISSILLDTNSSYDRGYKNPNDVKGPSVIVDNPVIHECDHSSIIDNQFMRPQNEIVSARLDAIQRSSLAVIGGRAIENANENEMNQESIDERKHLLSLMLKQIESRQQRPEAAIRSDSMKFRIKGSKFVNEKGCSWWPKKFPFGKSMTLKRKFASFLNYMSTKRKCKARYYHSQEHNGIAEVITRDIAPTPPIRKRRRPPRSGAKLAVRSKSSKSIQWDMNASVSVDKIQPTSGGADVQVQEGQQTDDVIFEILAAEKTTMTCGTNTVEKRSHIFSSDDSKKFASPSQRKEILFLPNEGIIPVTNHSYQPHVEPNIKASIEKDSRTSSSITNNNDNPSSEVSTLLHRNNSQSKLCRKQATPNSLGKLKVSCSLSSKIPTAIKPVATSNFSSITSNKRPSTAPSLDNTTSEFSQSQALPGAADMPSKTSGTESVVGPKSRKKMLFKHNRSSLLRINNSTSRKCVTRLGSFNLPETITTGNNFERKITPEGFTSYVTNSREKYPEISSAEKNQCLGTSLLTETKNSREKVEECPMSSPARQERIDLKYLGNFESDHLPEDNCYMPSSDLEYLKNGRRMSKILSNSDEIQDDMCESALLQNEHIINSNIFGLRKSSLKYLDDSVRFKSIPTSRVSPQFGTAGKKIGDRGKLPRKRTTHPGLIIARFQNPPNGKPNVSSSEETKIAENEGNFKSKESRLQRRIPTIWAVKTINSEDIKLATICKERNRNSQKILELIMHNLLDAAIRGSILTHRLRMNARVQVSSNKIIHGYVILNFEKFSSTVNEKFFGHLEEDGDEYFRSCSPNEKQEFGIQNSQKENDNWSKRVTINATSCMEAVPEEFLKKMENYLRESIIVFDLAGIIDESVTLCPSIFNVCLEAYMNEFKEGKVLKVFGSAGEEGFQDGRLSDANGNLRLTNDENPNKSLKDATNVKIDNKVLEEKVKCSIENGVPLKTITITDPSSIRGFSLMNNTSLTNIYDVDSKKMFSDVL